MAAQRLRIRHPSSRPDVVLAVLISILCAGLILLAPYLAADSAERVGSDTLAKRSIQAQSLKGLPGTDLTEDEAIVHALNRLGYGPRPGDVTETA